MSEQLVALTGLIYDAVGGGTSWTTVGKDLERLVKAGSASIMAGDFSTGETEILYHAEIPHASVAAYRQHYRSVDLWTNRAAAAAAHDHPGQRPRVWTSGHLVPDSEYLRSEFYNEFGRHLGLRYVVGTVVHLGAAGIMPIGLHRPDGAAPFDTEDARLLETVLPHLRRALQLRHQLRPAQAMMSAAEAALDAVPVGAIIVDADARVLRANIAAEAIAASTNAIRLRQVHGCAQGRLVLTACHTGENAQLLHLIRRTALGGASGGALRTWDHSRTNPVAVLVSPLPRRLAGGEAGLAGRVPGRALVLVRDLSAARIPPPVRLLRELFGLTANEAEVACALYGGATKDAVAAARGVRASTIKTQVDAILAKTGATNLRDLERLLGGL